MPRQLLPLLLASLLTVPLLVGIAEQARAADGGLVVIADTRYQALPEEGRVHVTLDAVATSFEPNTSEGQVYYSGITFAVPATATNIVATAGGLRLGVRVVEEADAYRAVEVSFGRGVFFEQSYAYTVSFDMVDPGGAGNRDLRIGTSLVAFPVWAFGSEAEPGSSIRVELPAGYSPQVQGSEMSASRDAAGRQILTAEPEDPFAFFAYVSADRPGAYVDTPVEVITSRERPEVVVRAWEDDPNWGQRIARLMADGLPALERLIGVLYPHAGRLRIEEAAISRLGQYAGLYDRLSGVIQVRYDADAFVALHEAAHVWFNDRLFDERWIGEAWAEFYAVEAGEALGATGFVWELTDELLESRIPLNGWGAVGRENLDVEDFAYAASYEVARQIAERAGLDGLSRVWRAAAAREPAYLPTHGDAGDEISALLGQPGWQRLLDLLEERTEAAYADIWAEWIVNSEQQRLLALRAHARSRHAAVRAAAEDWELPAAIRLQLSSWRFRDAVSALDDAEGVLRRWSVVVQEAADLELEPSDRVRVAFETESDLSAAQALVAVELDALTDLSRAAARMSRAPGPLEVLGLWGRDPAPLLADARRAYEAGQLGTARRSALAAVEARDSAAAIGRSRATLGAAALLGLDGLVLVGISGLGRGARRASGAPA